MVRISLEANDILLHQKSGGEDWATVACWWARRNYEIWKGWIRDPTDCSSGQGVRRAQGLHGQDWLLGGGFISLRDLR